MALINCPECGKEISDQVKRCPHCGYPLKKTAPWKIAVPIVAAVGVCAGGAAIYNHAVVEPRTTYNRALSLYDQGKYEEAARYFGQIPKYKDVQDYMADIDTNRVYEEAVELSEEGRYEEADSLFASIGEYKDSADYRASIAEEITYQEAEELFAGGSYEEAKEKLQSVTDKGRAEELSARIEEVETACSEAEAYYAEGNYDDALAVLDTIAGYGRADALKEEISAVKASCEEAQLLYEQGRYDEAREVLAPAAESVQGAELLKQMTANEETNGYIDQVTAFAFSAETGSLTARQILEDEIRVWCNAAWQEYDWLTDIYTTDENYEFIDPDQALANLAGSESFTEEQKLLGSNRETVMAQYTDLDSVPAGLEDVYEKVQLLQNAYRDLTDLAMNPVSDGVEDINDFMSGTQAFYEKFENQLAELKEAIPEKIAIVSGEAETFDFRQVRFGMTADEVKAAEADAYGLEPEWEFADFIGYTSEETEDSPALEFIYELDDERKLSSVLILADGYETETGEDAVKQVLKALYGDLVLADGTVPGITAELDEYADMIILSPENSEAAGETGEQAEGGETALPAGDSGEEEPVESLAEETEMPGETEEILYETEDLSEAQLIEEGTESVLEGFAYVPEAPEESSTQAAQEEVSGLEAAEETEAVYAQTEAVEESGALFAETETAEESGSIFAETETVEEGGALFAETETAEEGGALFAETETVEEGGAFFAETETAEEDTEEAAETVEEGGAVLSFAGTEPAAEEETTALEAVAAEEDTEVLEETEAAEEGAEALEETEAAQEAVLSFAGAEPAAEEETEMLFAAEPAPEEETEMLFAAEEETVMPEAETEMLFAAEPAPEAETEMLFAAEPAPEAETEMLSAAEPAPEAETEVLFAAEPAPEEETEMLFAAESAPETEMALEEALPGETEAVEETTGNVAVLNIASDAGTVTDTDAEAEEAETEVLIEAEAAPEEETEGLFAAEEAETEPEEKALLDQIEELINLASAKAAAEKIQGQNELFSGSFGRPFEKETEEESLEDLIAEIGTLLEEAEAEAETEEDASDEKGEEGSLLELIEGTDDDRLEELQDAFANLQASLEAADTGAMA